jgi:hypothetical protein
MFAWGLGASVYGLLGATNFRGFADKYARRAEVSSATRRRRPPWTGQLPLDDPAERTRRVRRMAIPFAIGGPVVTVIGLISISRGEVAGPEPFGLPSPFRYLLIGFIAAGAVWSWRSRRGLFHAAAWHHGWRLAVALLSSLGLLAAGIGFAVGYMTLAIAGMVFGALAYLILVMEGKPDGPGRGNLSG